MRSELVNHSLDLGVAARSRLTHQGRGRNKPRKAPLKLRRGLVRHAGSRPCQQQAVAVQGRQRGQVVRKLNPGHSLRQAQTTQPRCGYHAGAVRHIEARAFQQVAELRIAARLHDDLGIDRDQMRVLAST